jgi:hypothetical protein
MTDSTDSVSAASATDADWTDDDDRLVKSLRSADIIQYSAGAEAPERLLLFLLLLPPFLALDSATEMSGNDDDADVAPFIVVVPLVLYRLL